MTQQQIAEALKPLRDDWRLRIKDCAEIRDCSVGALAIAAEHRRDERKMALRELDEALAPLAHGTERTTTTEEYRIFIEDLHGDEVCGTRSYGAPTLASAHDVAAAFRNANTRTYVQTRKVTVSETEWTPAQPASPAPATTAEPTDRRCVDPACPMPYDHHVYDMKCQSRVQANPPATLAPLAEEPESPILAFQRWAENFTSINRRKLTQDEYQIAQSSFYAAHPGEGPSSAFMAHDPPAPTLDQILDLAQSGQLDRARALFSAAATRNFRDPAGEPAAGGPPMTDYERGRLDVQRELTAAVERFNADDSLGIGDLIGVIQPWLDPDELPAPRETPPEDEAAIQARIDALPSPQSSFDARVWAEAFVAHVRLRPSIATDEGTMIGWFSNSLMAGYDERARQEARFYGEPPEDRIGRVRGCGVVGRVARCEMFRHERHERDHAINGD